MEEKAQTQRAEKVPGSLSEASFVMEFVSLHHHTTYSFGDGFGTPEQHAQRAADLGYSAISFTEHGNVSSHFRAEKASSQIGIKPIFGLEGYCGPVGETKTQLKNHLTILAKDADGYRNLNRIVTQSYRDFFYHPTISGSSLAGNSSGLVILSGCTGSLLACTFTGGKGIPEPEGGYDFDGACAVIEGFKRAFGDDYWLEVQPFPELEKTVALNTGYVTLSKEMDVPLVVTNDVHYPKPEDSEMQAVLHAVHRGKATVDDQLREWNYNVLLTLPESDRGLSEKLVGTGLTPRIARQAIENSAFIAGQCNVTLPKAERLEYPISEQDLVPWNL